MDEIINFCKCYDILIERNVKGEMVFGANSLGKVLNLSNIRPSLAKIAPTEKHIISIQTNGGSQKAVFLTKHGVQHLISSSRSKEVQNIAHAFGVTVTKNHYICIESAAITFLSECLHGINMIPQYSVGSYRIDLYFPDYNVAIECDEHTGHSSEIDMKYDLERQLFIERTLGCIFVRFRPQDKDFSLTKMLNECLKTFGLIAPSH